VCRPVTRWKRAKGVSAIAGFGTLPPYLNKPTSNIKSCGRLVCSVNPGKKIHIFNSPETMADSTILILSSRVPHWSPTSRENQIFWEHMFSLFYLLNLYWDIYLYTSQYEFNGWENNHMCSSKNTAFVHTGGGYQTSPAEARATRTAAHKYTMRICKIYLWFSYYLK